MSRYRWRGGEEFVFRLGVNCPRQAIVSPALFEEANRTRRLVVTLMRQLEARGIGTSLPDLPGTGESLASLAETSFEDWREALACAAEAVGATMMLSLRGGALLDDAAGLPCWRLAPAEGASVVRDLERAGAIGGGRLLAGYEIAPAMLDALRTATVQGEARTVRLESDQAPADLRLPGAPLWRRAEPDEDPALADALADDIARWAGTCAKF